MAEASWITETVTDKDGKAVTKKLGDMEVPPGINMVGDRRRIMGAVAAQQVLSAGGSTNDAIDAAIKAQRAIPEEAKEPEATGMDPELEKMIRYVHAIMRLTNGHYEDLTPLGMLEVAMLCPHPVVSFEAWKQKMTEATGAE